MKQRFIQGQQIYVQLVLIARGHYKYLFLSASTFYCNVGTQGTQERPKTGPL